MTTPKFKRCPAKKKAKVKKMNNAIEELIDKIYESLGPGSEDMDDCCGKTVSVICDAIREWAKDKIITIDLP